ncbi:DNA phosphorothioation system sulfurtransferase DndC [Pseudoalteromonas sp. CST5]|uniref:DNA phosphorothioation system sulfurtransferase DndC n=1 Tax=unclassified Pseudoalteromonas TaxID=194690 RepID=UPI002359BFF3|nr:MULTISPECIES: DNA phosphorothioation system sulfurtransferase DndC [unclassified Pseudoalteromonas]MDC9512483.1 DNA phosphorothioation system sulfurtransferase DndC [Pseudoalteromonas sp. CST1]MDC9536719.1 DNA phosphorothioation system sulfurtransferase DndC [Pseudoalteromonas sp. CST3]MDC9540747.1 DNA phosphorothioation system sulfurtransferase DndC [Pseudoalteromonas sp. CST2]MDC9545422.1 DNA phosphorothioation system sulfurtransferase DndC [Pseudoalteromonas sp. CST4]MDC9549909.1 DNA pho
MKLLNQYDLEDYIEFIENESFAGSQLHNFVADTQRVYMADKRPWVLGYSGGKDSSAVMTLIYFALLGLKPEDRHKPVFVVASDTLVETPMVVDHVDKSLKLIEEGAKREGLPITSHKVVPKSNNTFWANLLGKGYPAPTRNFRWCTERMKIDPVSTFIKERVSEYDEVIVVLGSRSQESASRAQVIKKHKIDGSDLAVHTTLSNAFIYTPIDTWSVDDVWKILRLCHLKTEETPYGTKNKWFDKYDLEWENPWGGKNLVLWNLYKDSSGQGECPMVIDETTPSCGNSRFGCWTCTVVTRDRAMESLIQNGEQWMTPLLKYRNILSRSTSPKLKKKYRNHIRRDGRLAFKTLKEDKERVLTDDYTTGPYKLKYRQHAMRLLLNIQKQFNDQGRDVELITVDELHAVRHEWLNDPNEPDWDDTLPGIVFDALGIKLDWTIDDSNQFSLTEGQLLNDIAPKHGVSPQMVKKLIDVETQMSGLARRTGIFNRIGRLIQQDWESAEVIIASNLDIRQSQMRQSNEVKALEDDLKQINALLKAEGIE